MPRSRVLERGEYVYNILSLPLLRDYVSLNSFGTMLLPVAAKQLRSDYASIISHPSALPFPNACHIQ